MMPPDAKKTPMPPEDNRAQALRQVNPPNPTEKNTELHDPNIAPSDPNLVGVIRPKDMLRMVLSLTVICVCVALLLSVVHALTEDKINENLAEAERAGIIRVFGFDDISYSPLSGTPDTVNAVYEVRRGGDLIGWCVTVSPNGFGGNIDMVVGIGTGGKIVGVTITALSETPGLGSRVSEESYLGGYAQLDAAAPLVLNSDVDAISGATISSRSVLAGVNRATEAVRGMGLLGGETNE